MKKSVTLKPKKILKTSVTKISNNLSNKSKLEIELNTM